VIKVYRDEKRTSPGRGANSYSKSEMDLLEHKLIMAHKEVEDIKLHKNRIEG